MVQLFIEKLFSLFHFRLFDAGQWLLLSLHSKPSGAYAACKAESACVAVFGIKLSDGAVWQSNNSHLAVSG